MSRAAVFHNAKPARGYLIDDAVIEQDHAVGHILFQSIASQGFFPALAGDHSGDATVLEPAKQAPKLGTQDGMVGNVAEQGFNRVQRHALGADGVDGVTNANEQAFQVVAAGFHQLGRIYADEVQRQLALALHGIEVIANGAHIGRQLLGRLFKQDDGARLVVLRRAAHDELGRHQGFAAACSAADQRRAPGGKATARDFIQTFDSGGRFPEGGWR